jgi:hypothetical protein
MMAKLKWRFRRNWWGKQVLQSCHRRPANTYGDFEDFYRDATQQEVVEFTTEILMLMEKVEIVKKMKDEHPEYFLIN